MEKKYISEFFHQKKKKNRFRFYSECETPYSASFHFYYILH